MKKLKFKVSSPKDGSVVSLFMEVNKISCQIFLDLKNGFVVVENVNNSMIDNVIELVDNYYTILSIDIDNTFEEITQDPAIPIGSKTFAEDDDLPFTIKETSAKADKTADNVAEIPIEAKETVVEAVKSKSTVKKVGGEESALLEVIGFALDNLDSSKNVEEQVVPFLTDIGMTTTERMVTQSFIVSCDIKKINYENVILVLRDKFPKVKEELIKNILKKAFKNWLDKYPTLAEKCPKISLMAVLKVFAKRFA